MRNYYRYRSCEACHFRYWREKSISWISLIHSPPDSNTWFPPVSDLRDEAFAPEQRQHADFTMQFCKGKTDYSLRPQHLCLCYVLVQIMWGCGPVVVIGLEYDWTHATRCTCCCGSGSGLAGRWVAFLSLRITNRGRLDHGFGLKKVQISYLKVKVTRKKMTGVKCRVYYRALVHFAHLLWVLSAFTLTEPAEFSALKVPGWRTRNGKKMKNKTMDTTRTKRAPS